MTADMPFFDMIRFRPATQYEKFVDCLFYSCLLLTPFTHVFVDRDTGSGAFVKYFYILFFILFHDFIQFLSDGNDVILQLCIFDDSCF